jgi:16S rRNA (adenine1518-N6/adenine1519-N6)-dimethyltransferase
VTLSRNSVAELLSAHGLTPSRALGQNFVADPNTVRRVARLAGVGDGDLALEIGAGLGSLTLALVETGAEVIAIEVDRHLIAPLAEVLAHTDVKIVNADAMSLDYDELVGQRKSTVVANLPYNIATPLVIHLLESVPQVAKLVVMVQHEVAERLAARAGDDSYGAASLRVQYFADARLLGRVPASVFVPRPRVESSLIEIVRRDRVAIDPAQVPEDALFTLIKRAFGQRRKMLRRSLSGVVDAEAFERSGVAGTRRPEELTIEEFAALAAAT